MLFSAFYKIIELENRVVQFLQAHAVLTDASNLICIKSDGVTKLCMGKKIQ